MTPSPHDTAAALRGAYAADGGSPALFSQKVQDYVASRPDYPVALLQALARRCPPGADVQVVDVGAGTGLLTQGLLQAGYAVLAVEPSEAMRSAADHALGRFPCYRSAAGTAEQLPVPEGSVALITAAQAFHWFEVEAARAEFLRVLRPEGQVALVWNDRVRSDPLHQLLDERVFGPFGGSKRGALLAHEERDHVPQFFRHGRFDELDWPHQHRLDYAGLLSLVCSRSYMPQRGAPGFDALVECVRQVFDRCAEAGEVVVRYRTVAMIGRPA